MQLVYANDFEAVKKIYIDVIENTPLIEQYARWVYGKHPTDEQLRAYILHDEMYFLMDEDEVAGVVAINPSDNNGSLVPYVTMSVMEIVVLIVVKLLRRKKL